MSHHSPKPNTSFSPSMSGLSANVALLEGDKQAKKALVLLLIEQQTDKELCDALSPGNGPRLPLQIDILSGGLTNYSYRVFCSETDKYKEGDGVLFCKLAFSYALWSPTKEFYDSARAQDEMTSMAHFSSCSSSAVVPCAKPFVCIDIPNEDKDAGGDSKLLVTEYTTGFDEQLCNQVIEGEVDPRTAQHIGFALADLSTSDEQNALVDFNRHVAEGYEGCFIHIGETLGKVLADDDDTSDFKNLLKGSHDVEDLVSKIAASYKRRDCLVHNDAHVFNILCEGKPPVEHFANFGATGQVRIVDWEQCSYGSIGRDLGILWAFPVASAINLYRLQEADDSDKVLKWIRLTWAHYSSKVRSNLATGRASSSESEIDLRLKLALSQSIGWAGTFMLMMHTMSFHFDLLSEQEDDVATAEVRSACACLSLLFIDWGFGEEIQSLSTDDMLTHFVKLVEKARTHLLIRPRVIRRNTRRLSVLRETGRRISDAGLSQSFARKCESAAAGGEWK